MKPFSFRLEKVLRYRAHLEKRVQLQFCEAAEKVNEQRARIVALSETRMDGAARLARERAEGIPVGRDHLYASFLQGVGERITEEGRKLEKSFERLERLRGLLLVAAAKKKSLESLKDVQVARFKEEGNRVEQKLLDELVLTTRKRKEP